MSGPDPIDAPEGGESSAIDYLAKDYDSFRQLMLDQITARLPSWTERNEADIGNVIVDILAYGADNLSYYQDAVAAEAYLSTARRRISVRRHARLLDYRLHEGCAARVWLHLGVAKPMVLRRGFTVSCDDTDSGSASGSHQVGGPLTSVVGKTLFETLDDASLRPDKERMGLYDRGQSDFILPAGVAEADLVIGEGAMALNQGEVVILAAVLGLQGDEQTASEIKSLRHPVRLNRPPKVVRQTPTGEPVVRIFWAHHDALPFDLPVSARGPSGAVVRGLAQAWGNIVPADAGLSVAEKRALPLVEAADGAISAQLQFGAPVHVVPFVAARDRHLPAADFLAHDAVQAVPALSLLETMPSGGTAVWAARPDLLSSDRFSRDVVLEVESDGRALLRFGDGQHGWRPSSDAVFTARYRIGTGTSTGNVAAETVRNWHPRDDDDGVLSVTNPLPAGGGCPPQSMDQARRDAPQMFRQQKRCVTLDDYCQTLLSFPHVKAVAPTSQWSGVGTGLGRSLVFHVQRQGDIETDPAYLAELSAKLEPLRVLGGDFVLKPPRLVPLSVALQAVCRPGHAPGPVKRAIEMTVRRHFLADRLSFGESLYLSQLLEVVMTVSGVSDVAFQRFLRLDGRGGERLVVGRIDADATEILRLQPGAGDGCGGLLDIMMVAS